MSYYENKDLTFSGKGEFMKFKSFGIQITNYCNSRCKFCLTIGITNNEKQEKYIPFSKGKELIKLASTLGCKKIVFTGGGEPTTRFNDLIKLMRFAKSRNMRVLLVTNAFYARNEEESKNKLSKMINSGLELINFSFDFDHLSYIPFETYINAIKSTLKYRKLKVGISCVDRKSTKEKNTEYLKKLTNTLNGRFRTSFLCKKIKLFLDSETSWIYLKEKVITVVRGPVLYFGRAKSLKHEFDFKKTKKLIFDNTPCSLSQRAYGTSFLLTNYKQGMLVNCCVLPYTFQYKKNTFEKNIKIELNNILKTFSNIGFLKLYLSIKNLELKSGKKLLKEKYPLKCNLCVDMIKIKKKTKLNEPTKIQVISFIIKNLNPFLRKCLCDILFRLYYRIVI